LIRRKEPINDQFVVFLHFGLIHSLIYSHAASYLKIETPTPYALRNSSTLQYGINFAQGGTGIFQTLTNGPNMTVQIDSLEKLIQQNVYTKQDLESSVALIGASGNDYTAFIVNNRSITVSG
jgi:hypothetical protein